jgi:large subunit ribosomal protein L19
MTITLQKFNHSRTRNDLPNIKPGHVVKVYQKIVETKDNGKKEETKERIQIFEGLVIGHKGGNNINATITVRKISNGIGVERIFPLNALTIEKIELVKITKARRAKLNYMRTRIGKATQPKGEMVKPEENMPKAADKSSEIKTEGDKSDNAEAKVEEKGAEETKENKTEKETKESVSEEKEIEKDEREK